VISAVAALTALNDSTIAPRWIARARIGQNATFARGDCASQFSRELVIDRGVFFRVRPSNNSGFTLLSYGRVPCSGASST
jgi:hypothetical protein